MDGFVLEGEVKLLLPHEKFVVTAGRTTLPGGHAFPYEADETLLKAIEDSITEAIRATGLDNCAFNADVMISGQQPYILEIGGRCGATCIPELISLYCGFDYYQKMLEAALGEKPDFSYEKTTPCMAKLLFSPVDGIITAIDHEKLTVLQEEGVSFSLDYKVGDSVEKVKNGHGPYRSGDPCNHRRSRAGRSGQPHPVSHRDRRNAAFPSLGAGTVKTESPHRNQVKIFTV